MPGRCSKTGSEKWDMPRRRDLRSICLIGSGPIVIGQACEFDYAGSQALKVLREDGFRTIVVNSNPATIMTDPGFADRTYLEPLDLDGVADVLGRERPDALLPTLGGPTALNLAMEVVAEGGRDEVVIVCSIENLDPMGIHTGDSVTVAPQMTLSDEAYQELRDAAAEVIRAVGVECGGSNIQFARHRESGELRVIEMNPRVSRSSALASKATGYPIAKVAAKLAVGYTLDEIPNDLTGTTPASFEPTLDYVVVKAPRFAFEKFPGADTTLGTQMKSVGEAMGIGRTFTEAFAKALRSRELDGGAVTPWRGLDNLPEGLHPWFRAELERLRLGPLHLEDLVADDWLRLKRLGHSDAAVAEACGVTEEQARAARRSWGVHPAFRQVDSCAGEVEAGSNYLYSTWGEASDVEPCGGSVVILGSGPNRIRPGIEFDYCCVPAAQSFRALGYGAVMVNCHPETVSTDYDTSDRLYFEPLGVEEVLAVCEREQPEGVVIQFGGQTPLKLARAI